MNGLDYFKRKKSSKKPTSVRLLQEDIDFIKRNNLDLPFMISYLIKELKQKEGR